MDSNYGSSLKTALLYADSLDWCPLMLPIESTHGALLSSGFSMIAGHIDNEASSGKPMDEVTDFLVTYNSILRTHVQVMAELSGCPHVNLLTGPRPVKKAAPNVHSLLEKGLGITEMLSALQASEQKDLLLSELGALWNIFEAEVTGTEMAQHPLVDAHLTSASSVTLDSGNPYSKKLKLADDVDPLVGRLLESLVKTAVPSVEDLPFDVILQLRQAIEGDLGQLREELAGLTHELRRFAGENYDSAGLAKEARFIIETRIVPEAAKAANAVRLKRRDIARKAMSDAIIPTAAGVGATYLLAPPVAILIPVGGLIKVIYDILSAENPEAELSATSRVMFRLGRG